MGRDRIGIALSDARRKFAGPYENYNRRTPKLDAERFRRLVEEEKIVLFVVGLPIHCDGEESQKSVAAREFGEWLTAETGIEVRYFDERFTSRHAERILMEANLTKKQRKKRMDQVAAHIMLSGVSGIDRPLGRSGRSGRLTRYSCVISKLAESVPPSGTVNLTEPS